MPVSQLPESANTQNSQTLGFWSLVDRIDFFWVLLIMIKGKHIY